MFSPISSANTAIFLTNGSGVPSWVAAPLSVTYGGTGRTTITSNALLYGNGTSLISMLTPSSNSIITYNSSGIPATFANSLLTSTFLTCASGNLAWAALPLPVTSGGTNSTVYNNNGILYYSTSGSQFLSLTPAANSLVYYNGSSVPGTLSTLPFTMGGTGLSSISQYSLLYASAANTLSALAPTSSSILITNGSGQPIWAGAPLSITYGGTGLSSVAINSLLYASAANTLSALAPISNSILTTNGSGVPTWSAEPLSIAFGGTGSTSLTGDTIILSNSAGTALISLAVPGSDSILTCLSGVSPTYNSSFYTLLNTATANNTANALVLRDSNNNASINSIIQNYTTASTPLTLTASSAPYYNITSQITPNIILPNATTLRLYMRFTIYNSIDGVTLSIRNNATTQIGSIYP